MTKAYPAYKDSGVEWLGEVPEGWKVSVIKHVVSTPITDGPHETPEFLDEGVPFVSAEAVSSGKINFDSIRGHISPEDHARYSLKYTPQRNDIFMIKSGATTGVTAIVETDDEFNIWSPLAVVRCGDTAHPYFVLNFMRSQNFFEAVKLGWSFGTQQNIGMGVLENLNICLPPLHEQTAIAAFLDRETAKIDALVAEQRQLIDLLREKRQAVISHAVTKGLNPNTPLKASGVDWLGDVPEGWEVVQVRRLIVAFEQGYSPECFAYPAAPGEWGVLKSGCVNRGIYREEENKTLPPEIEPRPQWEVVKGDLLMSRASGSPELIGSVAIVEATQGRILMSDKILRLKLESIIRPDFAFWMFASDALRAQIVNAISGGDGMANNLPQSSIKVFRTGLPPLLEQEEIATYLKAQTAKLDTLTATAETAITLLQERRAALISAAVTGKIDVRHLSPTATEAA